MALAVLTTRRRRALAILACVWVFAIVLGLQQLWAYAARAGETPQTVSNWPAQTALPQPADKPTLIMFVHPQCPCSSASAEELARLLARCGTQLRVHVVAIQPATVSDDWSSAPLLQRLREMPGVTLHMDADGAEAQRFGAMTSGHTCLYSKDGKLLFSGGITPARGHAGDNPGSDAIFALVLEDAAADAETSVFGCSLFCR